MIVTFHLYKPRPNIHYLGSKYDFATKEEMKKLKDYTKNYPRELTKEEATLWDDFFADRYSDGQIQNEEFKNSNKTEHKVIDLTWYKQMSKCSSMNKGFYRLYKKLEKFNTDIITHSYGITSKYIVVDEILYRQGWFLKKNFFNLFQCFISLFLG